MKKTLILLALVAIVSTGCQTRMGRWYADQDWTPDSFDYTNYRDRHMGQDQHGFGVSWNLKPDEKK